MTKSDRKSISKISNSKDKNFDGMQSVIEMLNHLENNERNNLLINLEQLDPALVQKIRQQIFTFEDLLHLEKIGLQNLLSKFSSQHLALALRTIPAALRDQLLASLPSHHSKNIREQLLMQGPQKLSQVTSAQKEILDLAQMLLFSGKIVKRKDLPTPKI